METRNLILRGWTEADMPEFARLNSNDRVMEFFLKPLSYTETAEMYGQIQEEFQRCGFGVYAVEEKATHAFIGIVGLHRITFQADFTPAVEILWRLLPGFWGKGYAAEAAAACLEYAKKELNLTEIYAFTPLPNKRSERIMQKIGMQRIKEFGHPLVEAAHPLHLHVLYRIEL